MNALLLSLTVFVALHSIPAIPALKTGLIAQFGRKTYLVVYSLVSTVALIWVLQAALASDYVELWPVASWQVMVALTLSPIGLFFVLAGLISPNPASVTLRAGDAMGAITTITRHPVLLGFVLWSLGHLAPNGDLRSLILFGGLGIFSIGGVFMVDARARRRLGQDWDQIRLTTTIVPFAAALKGDTRMRVDFALIIALLGTVVLTIWFLHGGHALLFGPDPLSALAI